MRTSALNIAVAATALSVTGLAVPAFAGMSDGAAATRLTLSLVNTQAAETARPELTVAGRDGKYDRIETSSVRAALDLSAEPADAGSFRIVRSRLALTTDAAATEPDAVDTLSDAVPSASQSARSVYNLPVSLNGPVAQRAIALCNAVPVAERNTSTVRRAMSVMVAWRVTTGRFAFKWTNYDRVAPSDDILRNPDFYADQLTQSADVRVDVDVACAPISAAAIASKPAAESPVRRVALTSTPIAQPVAPTPVQEQKVSQADAGKPRCDGGMVRQISTAADSFLCLCPGNTSRVETGDNAFACARRTRR